MTYKVYIKNDYKPGVIWVDPRPWYRRIRYWLLLGILPFVFTLHGYFSGVKPGIDSQKVDAGLQARPHPVTVNYHNESALEMAAIPETPDKTVTDNSDDDATNVTDKTPGWVDVKIKNGDSLARVFSRLGLSPRDLHEIITGNKQTAVLKQLIPGQTVSFQVDDGNLQALKFEFDLTKTLWVTKKEDKFTSEIITTELDTRVRQTEGIINDSLFLSGQAVGLSDNLMMQLVDIYGWDIDFALDIRKGDSFNVVYEEKYKNLEKVIDGPILVAEFTNRNKKIRAVRYQRKDGQFDYYTAAGLSMRKAFLRTPLKFSRISSRFNLKRKHPILNRIRAHTGVDYAAPTGTPIKATGDGTIHHAGNKGGYGKTIIIKHGGKYSTLYAHLSRYKKGMKRGRSVRQGQIIGYVGKSGLATGPHLHYEFRVHDVHRNPLTVALPKADSIPQSEIDEFRSRTSHLFALLDSSQPVMAGNTRNINTELLAQTEHGLNSSIR